jgi:hypothetical protein
MRLDRRLSLPAAGFDAAHRERGHQWGGPAAPRFKTKPTLALERLRAGGPAGTGRLRWGTGDAALGRAPTCLDGGAAWPRG